MSDRRGFLKSLFAAPVAVAAWATVAEAKEPKKLERPNCLLAERDEVWTLADDFELPVRRIEVRLDFEPAVTWQFVPSPEQMAEWGYPEGTNPVHLIQRRVFPRMTEEELRIDSALQRRGHNPLRSPKQLVDVGHNDLGLLPGEAETFVKDTDTPFEEILRNRMTNAWLGYRPARTLGRPARDFVPTGRREDGFLPKRETPEPFGVLAILQTPTRTEYAIGVSEFPATSGDMLIQAPAASLFGS
jgi:hypothetical protein